MSLALTDFLIDVADPQKLRTFRENPDAYMSERGLSQPEQDAIRSQTSWRIRLFAPTADSDPVNSDGSLVRTHAAALIEIEPLVEIMQQDVDQVAIIDPKDGPLFVDDEGQLYKAILEQK